MISSSDTHAAGRAPADRIRAALYVVLSVVGAGAAIVAVVSRDLVAIVGFASLLLLAALLWTRKRRVLEAAAERERHQELLERQAVELEEQSAELQQQVEALAESNAALRAAEAATAEAHGRALEEAAGRLRQAALLDAAMNTSPIGLAILDRDLRYIRVNAAVAAITGVPVEAHPGRTVLEINPRFSPEVGAAIQRVLETGEPCLNFRITRPTAHAKGGSLEIMLQIAAFRDEKGEIAGICSAATDLSDWKSLQDQFFQAQKLEAVGQLAASIAHDFNNLLTIVSSCCDLMLLELPANATHRADVEEIRAAADRATTLARRMLGMAHHRVLVPTPVEFRTVVMEARDLLKRAAGKESRLHVQCDDETGVVKADPSQLEQVLLNLVLNAVDAMPSGGDVSVATRGVTLNGQLLMRSGPLAAGDYVELTVSDTGTGMPAATLARIFEPFFTTKPVGKGTGLGLATVFAIVRDLGGGVSVESAATMGTTFRILLPRVEMEETTGLRRARADAAAALPRGTETVLLVEDEDALRASVARVFTRQGFRVLQARHGGEALRMLAGNDDVALVVSDLHMPGVGGQELSTRIRALGRQLPVLFMSGSSAADGVEEALPELMDGRDRFISKPFEVEKLLTTVREMLAP